MGFGSKGKRFNCVTDGKASERSAKRNVCIHVDSKEELLNSEFVAMSGTWPSFLSYERHNREVTSVVSLPRSALGRPQAWPTQHPGRSEECHRTGAAAIGCWHTSRPGQRVAKRTPHTTKKKAKEKLFMQITPARVIQKTQAAAAADAARGRMAAAFAAAWHDGCRAPWSSIHALSTQSAVCGDTPF